MGAKKGDEKFNDRFEPPINSIFPLGSTRFLGKIAHFWGVVWEDVWTSEIMGNSE